MTRRTLTVFGKTLGDLSDPRVLAAYFVVYLGVLFFLAVALGNNLLPDGATNVPLADQEKFLRGGFLALAHLWAIGIGLLLLGAVSSANTLAKEAEAGTLRIVLSKRVRRLEVILGTFAGIVVFLTLAAVANVLLAGAGLFWFADIDAAALESGLFGAMPGNVVFALFVSTVVAAVGLALSVFTKSRLQTALGVLVMPALFFAPMVARLISPDFYEDYYLYLPDMSYHLGNVFVIIHEAVHGELPVEVATTLTVFSGVYDHQPGNGPPETLELSGYLDPGVSLGILAVLAAGALVAAAVQFHRLDV